MIFFELLFPGLGQYRRGQRLVGLTFGVSAVLIVLYMYASNQSFLYLHRDLRELVPRASTQELWDAKEAHKQRGLQIALVLLFLSAGDNWLASREKASPPPSETEKVIA